MATKVNRPRPATKHGHASDVRAGQYLTRSSTKPAKVRTIKSRVAGRMGDRR
jgi:hypothetical protein